ncbi:MAG TPA: glycosyltransferase [Roseiflexaceae bacterium]|nr:glycosyltransferase [Roseiflexaceae bacterium]
MISIVIPNLHSPLIGQVIEALGWQTARSIIREVIVVGQDRYRLIPADVRFIETARPISPAAARNLGTRQASGEYLLFLDADCIAAPDLVERIVERHRQGKPVVGGAVIAEAGNYWTLCDNLLVFGPYLCRAEAGARPYLPSHALSVAREVFAELGGFDESFAPTGEDMDLSLRLRARGYDLFFEPAACVAHRPPRASAAAIFGHLRSFGRGYYRVREQHPALQRSPLARLDRRAGGLLVALIPLLACKDILWQLASEPALRPFAPAAAGMIWGRMGWYLGVVEGLLTWPEHLV